MASSDVPELTAIMRNVSPRASSAMLIPPDAEPVIADSVVTDIATDMHFDAEGMAMQSSTFMSFRHIW